MIDPSFGTALVTGVLSGITAIYADRLAKRGHYLILIAGNEARLSALLGHLTNETGRAAKVRTRIEAARRAISQHFGNAVPASRYAPSARARERQRTP